MTRKELFGLLTIRVRDCNVKVEAELEAIALQRQLARPILRRQYAFELHIWRADL